MAKLNVPLILATLAAAGDFMRMDELAMKVTGDSSPEAYHEFADGVRTLAESFQLTGSAGLAVIPYRGHESHGVKMDKVEAPADTRPKRPRKSTKPVDPNATPVTPPKDYVPGVKKVDAAFWEAASAGEAICAQVKALLASAGIQAKVTGGKGTENTISATITLAR